MTLIFCKNQININTTYKKYITTLFQLLKTFGTHQKYAQHKWTRLQVFLCDEVNHEKITGQYYSILTAVCPIKNIQGLNFHRSFISKTYQ